MTTLLEKLAQAKAARLAKEIEEANGKPKVNGRKNDLLYGTGFTKSLIDKENRAKQKVIQGQINSSFVQRLKALKDKKPDATIEIVPAVPATEPAVISLQVPEEIKDPLNEIVLDEWQAHALNSLQYQKVGCLIGAAGTGKTTVTKKLVKLLEKTTPIVDINAGRRPPQEGELKKERHVAIAFCSFTGRAVQQMKRVLPKEYHSTAMTIHALLSFYPEYYMRLDAETKEEKESMRFVPWFTAANRLPYKIIVIDEAGMVPVDLFNQLVDALQDDVRIILIGDINQLPPVQGRSVLGFAMTKWPTYALEKIHRQAADNPIIANAHAILNGKFPTKKLKQFDIAPMPDGAIKTFNTLTYLVKKLHEKGEFNPITDAVIVPTNEKELGQQTINENLVLYFNPEKKVDGVVVNRRTNIATGISNAVFAVGDKVMLLQNDRERGLTNGMIGLITYIEENEAYDGARPGSQKIMDPSEIKLTSLDIHEFDEKEFKKEDKEESSSQRQASHITYVKFPEFDYEVQFKTAGDYRKITHAYAFTCHKSQGGEYPTVIILCHSANRNMLSREWLYTAVTRARERVVLCCNDRGLVHALNTQKIKGKNLQEKAAAFLALQDKTDTTLPELWEPKVLEP